jgi:hypothetical protein
MSLQSGWLCEVQSRHQPFHNRSQHSRHSQTNWTEKRGAGHVWPAPVDWSRGCVSRTWLLVLIGPADTGIGLVQVVCRNRLSQGALGDFVIGVGGPARGPPPAQPRSVIPRHNVQSCHKESAPDAGGRSTPPAGPELPSLPSPGSVRLRATEASQVGKLRKLPDRRRGRQRQLEGRPDPTQGRLRDAARARAPASRPKSVRVRTHPGGRTDPRQIPRRGRVRSPPQRCSRRQPPGEPRTVDPTAAHWDPRQRRHRLGAIDLRPLRGARCTSNNAHDLP